MSRQSSLVSHPNLNAINRDLVSGEPVPTIAKRHGVSQAALYRWRTSALSRVALESSTAASASVSDYLTVLSDSLRDADTVRRTALTLGQTSTVLKSAQVIGGLVNTMSARLGIDSTTTANMLADGDALVDAVLRVIRDDPALADKLARTLATQGHYELSGEFDSIAAQLGAPSKRESSS